MGSAFTITTRAPASLASGTTQFLRVYTVTGRSARAPKAYVQSSMHGSEVQGNAVIAALLEHLARERPLGDVTLVPNANPGAIDQKAAEYTPGRFDPTTGANWNRNYWLPAIRETARPAWTELKRRAWATMARQMRERGDGQAHRLQRRARQRTALDAGDLPDPRDAEAGSAERPQERFRQHDIHERHVGLERRVAEEDVQQLRGVVGRGRGRLRKPHAIVGVADSFDGHDVTHHPRRGFSVVQRIPGQLHGLLEEQSVGTLVDRRLVGANAIRDDQVVGGHRLSAGQLRPAATSSRPAAPLPPGSPLP